MSLRRGDHVDHPAVTCLRTPRLYVEAEPVQDVNADGELIGHTPDALRGWCPRRCASTRPRPARSPEPAH